MNSLLHNGLEREKGPDGDGEMEYSPIRVVGEEGGL